VEVSVLSAVKELMLKSFYVPNMYYTHTLADWRNFLDSPLAHLDKRQLCF
jgi:hypothetical protein